MKKHEHLEQVAFFQYVDFKLVKKFSFLKNLLFAVPNGGYRDKREAKRLKAEGVRRGVSDIICLYPSRGFCFLCIEMKYGKNKQSDNQKIFEAQVNNNGGIYQLAYSSKEAIKILEWYLASLNEQTIKE